MSPRPSRHRLLYIVSMLTIVQSANAQMPPTDGGKFLFIPILVTAASSALSTTLLESLGSLFRRLLTPVTNYGNNSPTLNPTGFNQPGNSPAAQPGYPSAAGLGSPPGSPAAYPPSDPQATASVAQPSYPAAAGLGTPPGLQPAYPPGSQPPSLPGMSNPSNANGVSRAQLEQLANTPIFTFMVSKLSDDTENASVTNNMRFENARQGSPDLHFDIRTGESFALSFATTVPGQVRLVNTDGAGVVSPLGIYEAIQGQDNRMPRKRGLKMEGNPGTEILDVEFTPCVSPQLAGDPRVSQFQGILPACALANATKQYVAAGAGGKGGFSVTGARAMHNMDNPDQSQPVMVAPRDYVKGGAMTFRIMANHMPKVN